MSASYRESKASCVETPAGTALLTGTEQLIGFVLKLFDRDFSTQVGLHLCEELVVLLHGGFAGRARWHFGAESLKVHAYAVEGEVASAIGTRNSQHGQVLLLR